MSHKTCIYYILKVRRTINHFLKLKNLLNVILIFFSSTITRIEIESSTFKMIIDIRTMLKLARHSKLINLVNTCKSSCIFEILNL